MNPWLTYMSAQLQARAAMAAPGELTAKGKLKEHALQQICKDIREAWDALDDASRAAWADIYKVQRNKRKADALVAATKAARPEEDTSGAQLSSHWACGCRAMPFRPNLVTDAYNSGCVAMPPRDAMFDETELTVIPSQDELVRRGARDPRLPPA